MHLQNFTKADKTSKKKSHNDTVYLYHIQIDIFCFNILGTEPVLPNPNGDCEFRKTRSLLRDGNRPFLRSLSVWSALSHAPTLRRSIPHRGTDPGELELQLGTIGLALDL